MSAEDIGYQAKNTAEWRRSKAAQFPDDARNLRAVEELECLAREIEALKGSEVYGQIDDAEDSLLAACKMDDYAGVLEDINEAVSAELRSVGFHSGHDGVGFLEWYRDLVREKLLDVVDKAVPAPDLHEQVANDPSVKAAKQAYDVAYAAALAAARKTV
jgi:hypothetical protein